VLVSVLVLVVVVSLLNVLQSQSSLAWPALPSVLIRRGGGHHVDQQNKQH
jgi:hypothetical protein